MVFTESDQQKCGESLLITQHYTESVIVRLMWIVTMLIAGGYYVFVVYNAFHKYYSRPINTVISTTHASKMNFPVITICPLNVFAKSKIFMTDDNPLFASNGLNLTLCSLTSKVRISLPCGVSVLCCCTPQEFLHFIQSRLPNCTSQYRQDLLEALQQSPNDHDIERFHHNYAQDIKVLVGPLCAFRWKKLPCSSNDFVSMVTPWGIYYTFNSGTDGKVKTVDSGGVSSGLSVILDAQTHECTYSRKIVRSI